MQSWRKQAALLLMTMAVLTLAGLYGVYLTMIRTTCADYDFIFSLDGLTEIKDFFGAMLNR